jgi:S1-C subfamily serine protease
MTTLSAFSHELAKVISQSALTVVALPAKRCCVSGVHWSPGIIVTTIDAVRCQEEMTLMTSAGEVLPASVVGSDPGTDIAVLRVEAPNLPTLEVGNLEDLQVGHLVLAIGRLEDGNIQASCGILASLGREWQSWTGGQIDRLIRPNIQPFSGFSGSPLLDVEGRVLGINTTYSRGRYAITIPPTTVDRVVAQILRAGKVTQGYLGVGLQPVELPTSQQQSLNLSQQVGVLIVSIEADSPADRAGVFIGDILLALDTEPVTSIRALRSQLRSERVGQPVVAQIIRGGELINLTLTIRLVAL